MISLKLDKCYTKDLLSEYSINIFVFKKIYLKKVKYQYKVGDDNDVIFTHNSTIDMANLHINNVSAHDYADTSLVITMMLKLMWLLKLARRLLVMVC